MTTTPDAIKPTLEAAIFIADEPLSIDRLLELFEDNQEITSQIIKESLASLQADYQGHGVELCEVATGYRFQVSTVIVPSLGKWLEDRPEKYSRSLLETLALIAYKQPITRADIEQVRGVAVSTQTIKTLMGREWVKVAGHRDVPGKPALYATTKKFLDYFGLKSLTDLPELLTSQEDEGAEQLELQLAAVQSEGLDFLEAPSQGDSLQSREEDEAVVNVQDELGCD
jgi:segregation and condensation protein B